MGTRAAREKLIQAIVYFGLNTRYLGKAKLFKLLYLLDSEHFRERGTPVTGLAYMAWEKGPVPEELNREWKSPEADFLDALHISRELIPGRRFLMEKVVAKTVFDPSAFTKRELRILEELATRFRDITGEKIIEVTHSAGGAWSLVWKDGEGRNSPIPLELAIPEGDPNRDFLVSAAARHRGRPHSSN